MTASSFSLGNRQHSHPHLVLVMQQHHLLVTRSVQVRAAARVTWDCRLESVLWLQAAGSWSPWYKLWNVTLGPHQTTTRRLTLTTPRQTGQDLYVLLPKIFYVLVPKYFTSSEPEDAECWRDVRITPSISAESWWDMRSVTELRTQRLRICRISEFAEHHNCDTVAVLAQ